MQAVREFRIEMQAYDTSSAFSKAGEECEVWMHNLFEQAAEGNSEAIRSAVKLGWEYGQNFYVPIAVFIRFREVHRVQNNYRGETTFFFFFELLGKE